MAHDRRRPRLQQRQARRQRRQQRTRKTGRLRPVLARIPERAHLARILQRLARFTRGQPIHLQAALAIETADAGRGRERGLVQLAQATDAAHAEAPITFLVTVALGHGIKIVPGPQQVRIAAPRQERAHPRVGLGRSRFDIAVGLLDLQHPEQQAVVVRPAHPVGDPVFDRRAAAPDLDLRRALFGQRHLQPARVVQRGAGKAEAEHGQCARVGQCRLALRGRDVRDTEQRGSGGRGSDCRGRCVVDRVAHFRM